MRRRFHGDSVAGDRHSVRDWQRSLLKLLIELIAGLLTSHFNTTEANWLYLVYPVAGILLTVLFVKYVVRENISHGVTKVLYAISRRKSRLKKRNIYASLIASSITIGFGGSVGAEGR